MTKVKVNFKRVSPTSAMFGGLKEGEFALYNSIEYGRTMLVIRIPNTLQRGNTSAFDVGVAETADYDGIIEPGFYPVRKGGLTYLAFYYEGKMYLFDTRKASGWVRLSGGVIDLDEENYRKEVLKHLEHLEREMRKLRKEQKGAKAPSIDEEVDALVKDKPRIDKILADMKARNLGD